MTITTNIKSSVHSAARLGVGALIGVAALTACGQATDDQATTPVIVPAASTLASSAAFDKQASLEVASDHALANEVVNAPVLPSSTFASSAAFDKQASLELASEHVLSQAGDSEGYSSPEAEDKQAMIEVAANHALNG